MELANTELDSDWARSHTQRWQKVVSSRVLGVGFAGCACSDAAWELRLNCPVRLTTVRTRMNEPSATPNNTWLIYTMLTVLSWGVYGILLHKGQTLMRAPGDLAADPAVLRYKAFLFVGVAYFLTAVLAPLFLLMSKGQAFSGYTSNGAWWSLIAGIAGAIGAFGVLLAFGAKGTPPVVMSIVFAGAPLINALLGSLLHPPKDGWSHVNPVFFLGILLAVRDRTSVV